MTQLYDPSRPDDLPDALRTAYGIIGVLLARHGSLELSDLTLAAIERGQGPVWESHPWGSGGVTIYASGAAGPGLSADS